MEAELAALAASGATQIMQLMASDAWDTIKRRVTALFRGQEEERSGTIASELEATRVAVVAAQGGDEETLNEIANQWRTRLLLLLLNDPASAERLRDLLAHSAHDSGGVHNTVSGGDINGPVVQTRVINGDLHFG
ncbi:hypothetical protein [Streptomyces panaciradicis]|uniref:hypothetical protein n=1 Tax=Streptomyces panaciradicis TaxID=1470261 RepID=UPI00201CD10E|nr:hypothetical protein [Streptomyces panaciradicis]MCL6675172.1 hypothetical protein [Streptomyces panaciradicis]